jgi:hypothetical protein
MVQTEHYKTTQAGCGWLRPVILATWEAEIRGNHSSGQPGQKLRSCLKYTQTKKRTGRVTQVVDCLPSKHKVLSSNPSTTNTYTHTKLGSWLLLAPLLFSRKWDHSFEGGLFGWFLFVFETECHYVAQAGLKPMILLPPLPECWNYRCLPLCQALALSLSFFLKYHFHWIIFPERSYSDPCLGFGEGYGAVPTGLSEGGVLGPSCSRRFLTTLRWMTHLSVMELCI